MGNQAQDWRRQAEADLTHARHSLDAAHYEWACFAAQQAAEKAVKSVHAHLGQEAWGHSVTELLEGLGELAVGAVGREGLLLARQTDPG